MKFTLNTSIITIEGEYSPQSNILNNTKAFSISTNVNYTPVFDSDPKAVGVKKGGNNNETAKIYLNKECADWILNAFEKELSNAGYSINDNNAEKQVDVTLNVKQFFVEPWVGMWSATIYSILSVDAKVAVRGDSFFCIFKVQITSYYNAVKIITVKGFIDLRWIPFFFDFLNLFLC